MSIWNPQYPPASSFEDGLSFKILGPQISVLVMVEDLAVTLDCDPLVVEFADEVDREAACGVLMPYVDASCPQHIGDIGWNSESTLPARAETR